MKKSKLLPLIGLLPMVPFIITYYFAIYLNYRRFFIFDFRSTERQDLSIGFIIANLVSIISTILLVILLAKTINKPNGSHKNLFISTIVSYVVSNTAFAIILAKWMYALCIPICAISATVFIVIMDYVMKHSKEGTNTKTAKIVQKNTIDHEYGHDWMVCFLPVVPLLILGVIAVIEMLFESSNNQYSSASHVYIMFICGLALAVMVFVLLLDLPLIICARDAYRITPVARRGLLKTGIIIHIIALALPVILSFRNLAFENPIVIIVLLAAAIYATWSLNKVYATITNHLASKGK